jgi:hypothetical protein
MSECGGGCWVVDGVYCGECWENRRVAVPDPLHEPKPGSRWNTWSAPGAKHPAVQLMDVSPSVVQLAVHDLAIVRIPVDELRALVAPWMEDKP